MGLKEMGKDFLWVVRKITNIITNSWTFPLTHQALTSNTLLYTNVGRVILNPETLYRKKVVEIEFVVESGVVGGGGMLCQLWDDTRGLEIGVISFAGGESDIIKSIDVISYIDLPLEPHVIVDFNMAKAAAGGAVTVHSASVIIKGLK